MAVVDGFVCIQPQEQHSKKVNVPDLRGGLWVANRLTLLLAGCDEGVKGLCTGLAGREAKACF